MTKHLLSKLPLSTWCLLAFCVALVLSVLVNSYQYELIIAAALLIIFIFLIASRQKESIILFFISSAIILVNYSYFTSQQLLPNSCMDARVVSGAKKLKMSFIYKVAGQNENFVINAKTDEFKISDKVYLCRKDSISLEKADQNYVLAQYKSKNVYSVDDLKKIEDGRGLRRFLFDLSVKIKETSSRIYSGDQGVLAYGLLFGSTGDFSSSAKADFKKSGTTHLVAVSGYNVSIITTWMFSSLRFISKNFAGIFSVILLVFFYFLTGGSASVLRAGIMGVVILLSKFVGRKVLPLHLLLLAATVILVFNPFAIYDWGFQLSFLATAGLFFLSPTLEQIFSFGRFKSILIKIFSETMGAQIFVLPIMVSNFGQISLIAPLSNLLILPFVPATMFFVAISLLASFIYPLLGTFFGGISNILLVYIMLVIKFCANVKFASILQSVSPLVGYLVGYALVIALTVFLRRLVAKRQTK